MQPAKKRFFTTDDLQKENYLDCFFFLRFDNHNFDNKCKMEMNSVITLALGRTG